MSVFAVKLVGLLGAAAVSTLGSFYIYDINYPKTLEKFLEWKGYTPAKEDAAFKAIFEEKKDQISKLKVEGLSESTPSDQAFSKLKDWCTKNFSLELKDVSDDVKNNSFEFCVDSYKTLKGALVRKGQSLATSDEDYKVIFSLYRGVKEFSSWLKGVSSNSLVNTEYSKLKEKCKSDLGKTLDKVSSAEISGASWWCVVPTEKTVGELLIKDNVSIISESSNDTDLWSKQFEGWKNKQEIIEAMKKFKTENSGLSSQTSGSEGGPKMKAWCEESKSKNLGEDDVYPTLYSQIKSVCTKKIEVNK